MSATARVGLVADSHVGEYLDEMPEAVFEALEGCDVILHAGDLSVPSVLDDLDRLAPVVAVRGDHDRLGDRSLPRDAIIQIAGHRIGLSHGDRAYALDLATVVCHLALRRRSAWRAGLHGSLLRRVGSVDCLVYGHWHDPLITHHGGTLMVSPGAVCPWGSLEGGRQPGTGWAGIADHAVARVRKQQGLFQMQPRVGILEVGSSGIRPVLIPIGPPTLPVV